MIKRKTKLHNNPTSNCDTPSGLCITFQLWQSSKSLSPTQKNVITGPAIQSSKKPRGYSDPTGVRPRSPPLLAPPPPKNDPLNGLRSGLLQSRPPPCLLFPAAPTRSSSLSCSASSLLPPKNATFTRSGLRGPGLCAPRDFPIGLLNASSSLEPPKKAPLRLQGLRIGERGPGLLGPLVDDVPGVVGLRRGEHGLRLLEPLVDPVAGGLRSGDHGPGLLVPSGEERTGERGPGLRDLLPRAAGFGDGVLLLSSSSSSLAPKKAPLKGLRRGDCREVWPSLGLVRRGDRSGLWRLTFQGEGGGVAFGVQTCVSDLTVRLQYGHLPDMKVLPPTVEYLCFTRRHGYGGYGRGDKDQTPRRGYVTKRTIRCYVRGYLTYLHTKDYSW